MFKIGDFSKISRVTVKTLRYYDEIGLLRPVSVDDFTGYRYYALEQLPRLNRILALKDLGLSLEQIDLLLNEDLTAEAIRGMLRLNQAELADHLREAQTRLARVEARLKLIEQEGKMPDYEVVLKKVDPIRVAEVQEVIPTIDAVSRTLNRTFDEADAFVEAHGGQYAGGGGIAVWYDEEERRTNMLVGAAVPIKGELTGSERVKVHDLPAYTMACVVHHGSFDEFQKPYQAVLTWIKDNGYRIVGPSREVYLQYCRNGNPADYVTEIQFPVEKA